MFFYVFDHVYQSLIQTKLDKTILFITILFIFYLKIRVIYVIFGIEKLISRDCIRL